MEEVIGIRLKADGTLETANGMKLTSTSVKDLATELDTLNGKAPAVQAGQKAIADSSKAVATNARESAQAVTQLGRDLAQGDFMGAAKNVGELALRNQALRAAIVGVGGLIGAAVIGVGALGYAALEGAEQQRKLNDTLILTGNYAGLVSGQLDAMASSIAGNIDGSVSGSREVLAGLTATGRFTVESLTEVATAAQLVQRFTGQTSEQVVRQFASMGDDAVKWAAKTNESYHFLQISTYEYIKQLQEQGRNQEAARVTGIALSNHLGGTLTNNLGTLQRAWQGVTNWADRAWNAMLGVGKTETTQQKIDTISTRLEYLAGQKNSKGWTADQKTQATSALEEQRAVLQADLRQERQLAEGRSQREQTAEAYIKADQAKKAAGRTGGRGAVDREPENERRLVSEMAGLSGSFAADWDRLTAVQRKNGLTVEWLTEAQAKLLAKQPGIRAEVQAQATALREMTQLREKNNQHMEREFSNQEKELDSLAKTNEGLREQALQVGLTKLELGGMKAARLDALIAHERENLIVAESNDAGERQLELMRRRIALLEQQRGLTQDLAAKTDAADKKKVQEEASKKFGDDISRDLRDGVIRGLEAGKNPLRAFADTFGNVVQQRLMAAFADSVTQGFEPLIKQAMAKLSGGAGGGGGGGLGGLLSGAFSFLSGGGYGDLTSGVPAMAAEFGGGGLMDSLASFGVFHSGGMAGGSAPATRMVSPSLFKGAPRFHGGGIAGNERAIIAKDDEGIFTPEQMASLAPVGAGAAPTINIITPPGMKAETKTRQTADGGMTTDVLISQLEEALADRVSAGTGALSGAFEGRYGVRTSVR